MAYGAALERRFGSNSIEGSNPSPSAMLHEASRKFVSSRWQAVLNRMEMTI